MIDARLWGPNACKYINFPRQMQTARLLCTFETYDSRKTPSVEQEAAQYSLFREPD